MKELQKKIEESKKQAALSTLYDELRNVLNQNFNDATSIKDKSEKILWFRNLINMIEAGDPNWEKHLNESK